ncbi:AAA family ATPase [Vibrio splendidus]|uniref:AAA family ATPase n=1 Tax=Vibrio splendidus TaxID=29497 RepID=UPI00030475B3|nr:AAA family ATPase [Vibrio splendidus]OEF78593.1 hypothetical protein A148_14060 [Vibrio splendidus 1F-157]
MTKIKSVDISDFRVYEGTVSFNFINPETNDITNLIGIYAPNGFGKTSFFDAIEWTYTNKIRRFETGLLKKEVKEEDFSIQDSIILTNRNSYKKNPSVKGKVSIVTGNGTIIKEVQPWKRPGKSIKYDYRAGKSMGSFDQKKVDKLPVTNVLTHDQVDSFLKLETPEGKFEALQDFWPEGKKSLEKYKKIFKLFNKVASKENDIDTQISELTLELSKIAPDSNKLTLLKNKIDEVNSNQFIDDEYTLIDESIGQVQFDNFEFTMSLNKKNLSKKIAIEEENQSKFKWLKDNYNNFNNNITKIESISIELKDFKERITNYSKLSHLLRKELTCQDRLNKYNAMLSDVSYVSENIIEYTKIQDDLKGIEADNSNYFEKIKSVNRKLDISRIQDSRLKNARESFESSLMSLTEDQKSLDLQILSYRKHRSQIDKLKIDLDTLLKKSDQYNNQIETLNSEVIDLESSVLNKDWGSIPVHTLFKDSTILNDVSNLKHHIDEKNKNLDQSLIELETIGELQENLSRLIIWGEQHVKHTSQTSCPLCSSKFKDCDEILKAIESNKQADSIAHIKKIEIDALKNELKILKHKNKTLEDKIIAIINNAILSNKKSVLDLKENLSILIREEFKISEQKRNREELIKETIGFFTKYNLDIEKLTNENIAELQTQMSNKIDITNEKLTRVEKLIASIFNTIKFNTESKVRYESTNRNNDNLEKMLKSSQVYQNCARIISEYQFKSDNGDDIARKRQEFELKISHETTSKSVVKAEIEDLNLKIAQDKCQLSESDTIKLYEGKQDTFSKLKSENSSYHERFTKNFPDIQPCDSYINRRLEVSQEKFSLISNTIHQLDVLQTHIDLAADQGKRSSLFEQITSLRDSSKPIRNLKLRLESLKNSCMKFMQEGIDIYFNKDIINQIYRRIEPHPSLKEINFIADIGEKGPRLRISAKGQDDEVNPSIYLSTGQVNILSLSIFLAQAFKNGSDTVSTIFMDDPLHNLSDINVLSFIDLLRSLTTVHDKQVVLSTHDEKFYKLLQCKLPVDFTNATYIELTSAGKLRS